MAVGLSRRATKEAIHTSAGQLHYQNALRAIPVEISPCMSYQFLLGAGPKARPGPMSLALSRMRNGLISICGH